MTVELLVEPVAALATVEIKRRPFTVAEYHQMLAVGILQENDRVELIEGEIRQMSAVDAIHTACVKRLNLHLTRQFGETFVISVQDPIYLDEHNEPEPDLAVLRWRDDFYEHHHPTPADVLLLIEVANSSLLYDRTEKLPRYAAAAIPEVWLVDLQHRLVEQYAGPLQGQYSEHRVFNCGMVLQSVTLVGFALAVDQLFGASG
jgi:Uma2 family endonuclease